MGRSDRESTECPAGSGAAMNTALVDGIVKAVLYEGYMLYPYRPSAVKNRQRFNFGVVYPRVYSDAQGSTDAWTMQTECLVLGTENTRCSVRVRFLRMVARSMGKRSSTSGGAGSKTEQEFEKVESLDVNGRTFRSWQEALEEEIEITEFNLSALIAERMQWPFRLSGKHDVEAIQDQDGAMAGAIFRDSTNLAGMIRLTAEQMKEGLFKLSVHISNESRMDSSGVISRDEALLRALVSAHTILEVQDGEFVSLVDPPEAYREMVVGCKNIGTWPVLVGEVGQHDTMLSSPIILYDYPQIAPESPGDLFDGAEIDEILSLRIMTMTEDEKKEMRESDDRARQVLERTEALPDEHFMKLHGALRGLRSVRGGTP